MRARHFCVAFAITILGRLVLPTAAHAIVTLNDGGVTKLELVVRDTNISFPDNLTDELFPASLPYNDSHMAIMGNSNSQAEYILNQNGFQITSSGARAGRLDSRANVQPVFFFSVSANTPYALSGALSLDDSSGKYAGMEVTLTDVDTSAVLYRNVQESFGVVNESFALGGMGGNVNNELSGAATGVLLAGHRYRLFYGTSIYASNSGDLATFTGAFEMSLVPEPATAWLCAMGLTFVLAGTRCSYRERSADWERKVCHQPESLI